MIHDAPVLRGPGTSRLRALIPSVLVNGLGSFLAYLALRPHVGTDAVALALAGAVPVTWTLGRFVWRRRLDPVGVLASAGYASGLLVSVLTGGSSLPLKVHPLTFVEGAAGLVLMVSVAVRRPLLPVILRRLGRVEAVSSRSLTRLTVFVGAALLVTTAIHVALALTLPTATFLVVNRFVDWALLAVGVVRVVWYQRRARAGGVTRDG